MELSTTCALGPWEQRPSRSNQEMTTRNSPFGNEPFRVSRALELGVGRGALDGPNFTRPFHGVREWRRNPEPPQRDGARRPSLHEQRRISFRRRCAQFATRMGDSDYFSHGTALILHGGPTPDRWDESIHVSAIRPRNPARTRGVISHRLAPRPAAFRVVGGLRVEHPVRAWVQASRHLSDVELIVAADYLVARRRPLATIAELLAEVRRQRRPRLEQLLHQVRDGSESAWETKLRVELVWGGLPEPELAFELFSTAGEFIARLDQAYPHLRVGVEYDGRQHAEDVAQFAKDADRWRRIADADWHLVRILKHHLEPDPGVAVDLVRRALLRAGWRP